ncbi:hypothetical protein SDRG_11705 [Saprolegnia diclina VS20]|uniref:UBX domain-containing protein n=1 Tax=Saprolegnia diclina (strain VS20) TaxID=1156394 RepID=T0QAU6_SAPDV|nr:hypothetical protein SDRG_11705 [Saprolegnia diclina VS20]EQC30650.1 hypothetical protein SDRG_11705 [Saprolegnia diclina VS20]|eukprot:XP_008615976.1 hypothetical protein SDRG_11705 [Saprolegnia diclina VS20]
MEDVGVETTGLRRRVGLGETSEPRPSPAPADAPSPPASPASVASELPSFWKSPLQYLFGTNPPPELLAQVLLDDMKKEYGALCPAFEPISFRDAANLAKTTGKFLFVYLHSEVHDDTPRFCKSALCTDEMVAFCLEHDNMVLWAGSVLQSEGYSVSLTLGAASFPFMSLLISTPRGLNVVEKIQGVVTKEQLTARLANAILRNQHHITASRAQEQFRTEAQILREEQDREYQVSLEADRLKAEEDERRRADEARQVAEEAARLEAERAAEEAQRLQKEREHQARAATIEAKRAALAHGPTARGKDTCLIRFQLYNGTRLERLFFAADTFQVVRDFVDVSLFEKELSIARYELATNFPRKAWGPDDVSSTLLDAGLAPQALLYVQDLDS